MKNEKKIFIQRQWCKGCRVCVTFCPKEVLALDGEDKVHVKNPDNCIYCGLCELRCPDLAIEVREARDDGPNPGCAAAGGKA
ncbi:hypothetical protein FACS1894206_09770 [Deltaproteobacteria bacterium]|nr:hypothetical protein FACS1894206_09770 [Deltaproteobacteria bacterium]